MLLYLNLKPQKNEFVMKNCTAIILRLLCLSMILAISMSINAQDATVSGRVIDNATNGTLPGATIMLKGTKTGTATDADGRFTINVSNLSDTLVVSSIGYVSKIVPIQHKSSIDIFLEQDIQQLQEVVVVGYGTQKKINLTGAVSQVDGKVLADRAIVNAGQGLQGTIANLNIVTNPGDPGKLGQGASFNIRGTTSINGGSPLILVDGFPADINNLNPSDIESVSVLKDAASAAIYGARAAYGVILITTKKGSAQKTVVSYSSSISSNYQTNLPKTVNSLTYAKVMNEAAANAGRPPLFSEEHIGRIESYMADPQNTPSTIPEPGNPTRWSYSLGNDNINYFEEYYKDGALSHKHDISLSGGQGETDYRVSLGYLDKDGVLRYGGDNFNRINFMSNVRTAPKEWIKFDISTLFSKSNNNEPYEYAGSMGNWFHTAYTRQPHWPLYDPNGNPFWTSQIQFFEGARSLTSSEELWLKGGVEIEPLSGWKINARYALNKSSSDIRSHEAKLFGHDVNNDPYTLFPNTSYSASNLDSDYTSLELFTTYDIKVNDHSITALLGSQTEKSSYFGVLGSVRDLVTDALPSINTGTGTKNVSDQRGHWANLGFFTRLNYNFKEKYLLEINGRYDGTSKFPSNQKWGFFPSISVGYNIANEDFFPLNEQQMSMLKLRASYGFLGNQQVANYMFYNRVPISTELYWLIDGQRPNYMQTPGLVSSDLTWEVAQTYNLGMDIIILKDRLNFSFDWYQRNTLDMIGVAQILPATLGTATPRTNNADLSTKGFELALNWRNMFGDDIQYDIGLNLSDNTTTITNYLNPDELIYDYYNGMVLGEIWGYETNGLIQTDEQLQTMADQTTYINANPWKLGDVEYKDLNGDGVISPGDRTLDNPGDLTIIGNNTPRYQFGLNLGFVWKWIDFRMFWQGTLKRDYWLGGIPFFGITGSWTQQIYETTLNHWSPDNTDAYFARPYSTGEMRKNQLVSSRYLQNAAYARLKNVQIGFTLPENVLSRLQLDKVRLFLNGENLFYLSPIDENFDPERLHGRWGAGKIYPLFRTFTAGINVDF